MLISVYKENTLFFLSLLLVVVLLNMVILTKIFNSSCQSESCRCVVAKWLALSTLSALILEKECKAEHVHSTFILYLSQVKNNVVMMYICLGAWRLCIMATKWRNACGTWLLLHHFCLVSKPALKVILQRCSILCYDWSGLIFNNSSSSHCKTNHTFLLKLSVVYGDIFLVGSIRCFVESL